MFVLSLRVQYSNMYIFSSVQVGGSLHFLSFVLLVQENVCTGTKTALQSSDAPIPPPGGQKSEEGQQGCVGSPQMVVALQRQRAL